MKLNLWSGSYFNSSGFASHTKQLFNALVAEGCDVRLQVPLPDNWIRMVNDQELAGIQKLMTRDRITIFIGHPQYLPLSFNESDNVIPYVVWEGDKVPVMWLQYLVDERIKLIFVPSEHVKKAILDTSADNCINHDINIRCDVFKLIDKIKVIPHGVSTELFKPKENKDNKIFTFLCNKGYNPVNGVNDRGGVPLVIKSFYEEFSNKEPVQLLIKLNPAYLQAPFNVKDVLKITETKEKEDSPLIKVGADNIDYNYMPSIYHDADVFVCASMAEGFNLPGLESHACGIATIQTNYGGNLTYMKPEIDFFIDYTPKENTWDILFEGVNWVQPDINHLKKLMRYCYENKEEVKIRGKLAVENAKNYTWTNTAKLIIKFINELN